MTGQLSAVRLIANQGAVGGGEVMLLRLAVALRELGRSVSVVAPQTPGEVAALLEQEGFRVERIPGDGRAAYLWALRHRVRPRDGEILWCNGLLPAVALTGRRSRVVHLHQLPASRLQGILARCARAGALATVVPSAWMAALLPGSIALPNWAPEPSAPDDSADEGRPGAPLVVGYLGRISVEKGVLDLITALGLLRQSHPNAARLLVAGDFRFVPSAQIQEIEHAAEQAGAAVQMLGWVDRSKLLRRIDLLAVPSIWPESFGLVAAEAMAQGVPVLVSDTGALPEVVGPDHPLIARAGDPQDLAQVILRAAALDRRELARQQHERWHRLWSPEAGRRRLQDFLRERGM